MNFSTHKKKLIELIETALIKNKKELINSFKPILSKANSLFKTDIFDFWLKQIGQIKCTEIPTTNFGLNEAKSIVGNLKKDFPSSKSMEHSLYAICEYLFSYCSDEEMCNLQSDFHFYYHIPTEKVFKESGLGTLVPFIDIKDISEIRIAKVSEIDINREELIS